MLFNYLSSVFVSAASWRHDLRTAAVIPRRRDRLRPFLRLDFPYRVVPVVIHAVKKVSYIFITV